MKRNTHFIVHEADFRIEAGREFMNEYTFNTGVAKHLFCRICGVCPFYRPRSNPLDWAVTVQCLEPGTVTGLDVKRFDGSNWEEHVEASGIQELSSSPCRL